MSARRRDQRPEQPIQPYLFSDLEAERVTAEADKIERAARRRAPAQPRAGWGWVPLVAFVEARHRAWMDEPIEE